MKTVNATHEENIPEGRIIAIRHAKTGDNVPEGHSFTVKGQTFVSNGLVISGHNGVELTDEGHNQCIVGGGQLARHLRNTGITSARQITLVSSDQPRARQTLRGFVDAMPGFGLDIETALYVPQLRERDAGDWENWLRHEALGVDSSIADAFKRAEYRYRNGESLMDCGTRAGSFLASLASAVTTTLVVVSHEITILGALDYLEHGEVTDRAWDRKGRVKNAGFFDLAFNRSTRRARVTYSWSE